MSIWTPHGEHDVPEERNDGTDPAEVSANPPGFDDLTPEEQEQARMMAAELAEVRQRLSETPAEDVIANHVMGIYELAAIHLSNEPPSIDAAKIAIDAISAILTGLQGRLGQNENVLREALQQIQVAFIQISEQKTLREEPKEDSQN